MEETRIKMKNVKIGKPQSEEHKKRKRETSTGKSCKIFDIKYPSIKEAARQLQLDPNTIRYRLRSDGAKFKDWKYCEDVL